MTHGSWSFSPLPIVCDWHAPADCWSLPRPVDLMCDFRFKPATKHDSGTLWLLSEAECVHIDNYDVICHESCLCKICLVKQESPGKITGCSAAKLKPACPSSNDPQSSSVIIDHGRWIWSGFNYCSKCSKNIFMIFSSVDISFSS